MLTARASRADRTAPSEYEGKYVIEVFLRCSGGTRFDRLDLRDRMFDSEALQLTDAGGQRGRLWGVNSDASHQSWTMRFFALDRAETLTIRNVARQSGQPGRFAVSLK